MCHPREKDISFSDSPPSPPQEPQTPDEDVQHNNNNDAAILQEILNSYLKEAKNCPPSSSSPYTCVSIRSAAKRIDFENVRSDIENFMPISSSEGNTNNYHHGNEVNIEATTVGAGLVNLGNTCFMNAILQCLTHTVPLIQELRSCAHVTPCENYVPLDYARFCAICVLHQHINTSIECSGRVFRPVGFADNLSNISSSFIRYEQNDAHEFMLSLLNKLRSCFVEENVIDKVFGGRLISTLECCNCDHSSISYEPMIDMSLDIEEAITLDRALAYFTISETIDEKLKCDGCLEEVVMVKKLMLNKAPQVLVLHLKRFSKTGDIVRKIDAHVCFDMELDLEHYTIRNDNETLKYNLYAVVVHDGSDPNSGHYYCFIRSAPDKWHKFDDDKVTSISGSHVLLEEAYILFYVQQGISWFGSTIIKNNENYDNPINLYNKKDSK